MKKPKRRIQKLEESEQTEKTGLLPNEETEEETDFNETESMNSPASDFHCY